jgi:hypothetical protein
MTNKPPFRPEKQFDPNELARISAALVAAIAEAQTVATHGKLGAEFRELLQHPREMHDLLVAHLQSTHARKHHARDSGRVPFAGPLWAAFA